MSAVKNLGLEKPPFNAMSELGKLVGVSEYRTNTDVVSYYGLKITTEKGRCTIDYRNDSNGYYGGWVEVVK